jgi:hypothetical protein
LVTKEYLPKQRATGCPREYRRVGSAFQTLFAPHVDPDIAKSVLDDTWLMLAPQ